jgi:RNA polymerase sigma factor (sigma-70 family)
MRLEKEAFYDAALDHAWRWTRKFGMQPDDAEECTQLFVFRLLLKPVAPPRWTWLKERIDRFLNTASRNHTINYLDGVRNDRAHFSGSALDPEDGSPVHASGLFANVEDGVMRDLFWHKIHSGLSKLAPHQRTLIERGTIEGASAEELAHLFGCSADSMKHRIARARKRLASILVRLGDTGAELQSCLPTYPLHYGSRNIPSVEPRTEQYFRK